MVVEVPVLVVIMEFMDILVQDLLVVATLNYRVIMGQKVQLYLPMEHLWAHLLVRAEVVV
jgi:hypothetical protein